MKRWIGLVTICLTAGIVVSAGQAPSPTTTTPATLATILEELRQKSNLPAVGGATFSSNGEPEVIAMGVRKLGADAVVMVNDLWHIGSITKSFTSLMVAQAIEKGEFTWTTTLKELVGERAGQYSEVTIEQLLGHRSGLQANVTPAILVPASAGAPSLTELRQRILTEALKSTPSAAPGVAFTYSNLGYVIAGAILESRAGKPWEDLVRAQVLSALSLDSAGHGAPGVLNELTQPRGHRGGTTPIEPGLFADNPPYLGPAGRLHLSLRDLARWGQEHLRGERGEKGLVSAETFARLHRSLPGGAYALGWVSQGTGTSRVIWHNGSNTMWYAIVAFNADRDRGIAIVTNGGIGAAGAVDAVAMGWLR